MGPVVQVVSPTDELLKTVEQLFSEQDPVSRRGIVRHPHAWRPPTDLCETEDAFVACIEVAGMKDGRLSVSIADKLLTVVGIRQHSGPKGAYHQMEIRYGEFYTQVRLPAAVDEDKVEASYADGFLTVVMPKQEAHRVKVVSSAPSESEPGQDGG